LAESEDAAEEEGLVTIEKPLYVRVAEALGWTDFVKTEDRNVGMPEEGGSFPSATPPTVWIATPPWNNKENHDCVYAWDNEPCSCYLELRVPRYDTDWAATGPLIDEWELDILHTGLPGPGCVSISGLAHCPTGRPGDEPYGGAWLTIKAEGPTTPIAVCHWLLAAHEKGACVSENLAHAEQAGLGPHF
jgi:hypothetical protein